MTHEEARREILRGDGRAAACFADAEGREIGGGVDQLDQHLRRLAEAQHRVALPVARADAAGVERHTFLQGPARGLDDAAFELVERALRIGHEPARSSWLDLAGYYNKVSRVVG